MARQLLERAGDLARIERALTSARDGRGSVIVVEGPAGIGMTSIMAAARAAAQERGLRVLRSRGAVLEREFAPRAPSRAAWCSPAWSR